MKRLTIKFVATLIPLYFLLAVSCGDVAVEETKIITKEQSLIPSETDSKLNQVFGCVETSTRQSEIKVWGNPPTNNIKFSLSYNNAGSSSSRVIFRNQNLQNKENAHSESIFFKNYGYNFLILTAFDPQQVYDQIYATISIDGVEKEVYATLDTNGCVDVIVTGHGVSCPSTGLDLGSVHFWSSQMPNCGNYTVEVDGFGNSQVSGAFAEAPECGDASNGGVFEDLPLGTYNYSITDCPDVNTTGTFELTQEGCIDIPINASSSSNTGDLMFWTDDLFGCTSLTITLSNGDSSVVTGTFNSVTDCSDGSKGGLFTDLPAGTYTYTITNCSPLNGTGTVEITDGGCTLELLFLL